MACSLQRLIRFQSTWREIAEGIGLVSKRVRSSDPHSNFQRVILTPVVELN